MLDIKKTMFLNIKNTAVLLMVIGSPFAVAGTATQSFNYKFIGKKENIPNSCTIVNIENIENDFLVPAGGLQQNAKLFSAPHNTEVKFKCTGTAAKTAIASIALSSNAQDAYYKHDHFPFVGSTQISSIRVKSYAIFGGNTAPNENDGNLTNKSTGVINNTTSIHVDNGNEQTIHLAFRPYADKIMTSVELVKTFVVNFTIEITYS